MVQNTKCAALIPKKNITSVRNVEAEALYIRCVNLDQLLPFLDYKIRPS
jgi:hypothetical protein